MTITEYSKKIKNDYEEHIVLIKYGKFYRAFDHDAFIINYLFNYKISSRDSVGFPIENLNKVLHVLNNNSISTIIIKSINDYIVYNSVDNKYNYYLKKSLDNINFNDSISHLNNLLVSKIKENNSLLFDIRSYLENL